MLIPCPIADLIIVHYKRIPKIVQISRKNNHFKNISKITKLSQCTLAAHIFDF